MQPEEILEFQSSSFGSLSSKPYLFAKTDPNLKFAAFKNQTLILTPAPRDIGVHEVYFVLIDGDLVLA